MDTCQIAWTWYSLCNWSDTIFQVFVYKQEGNGKNIKPPPKNPTLKKKTPHMGLERTQTVTLTGSLKVPSTGDNFGAIPGTLVRIGTLGQMQVEDHQDLVPKGAEFFMT